MRLLPLLLIALAGTGQSLTRPAPALPVKPLDVKRASGVVMPTLKDPVLPAYPESAVASRIQGAVELEIVVDARGEVPHVRVAKSVGEPLDTAARTSAYRWRLQPAVEVDGRPTAIVVGAQILFGVFDSTPRVSAKLFELPAQPLGPPEVPLQTAATAGSKTPGIESPRPVRMVQPAYTSEAMRAKIDGTVTLDIIVLPDGSVGDARIRHSLDKELGLDRQALIAARYWLFEPGKLNGQPVAISAVLQMVFKLH